MLFTVKLCLALPKRTSFCSLWYESRLLV